MAAFWILLIISIMYTVQSGRCCTTTNSSTELSVSQTDKDLSVEIGNSVTLQCCMFGITKSDVIWFKQQNREKFQIIVKVIQQTEETFYGEFQNPRFRIKQLANCFNLTISNITASDAAMYHCAIPSTSETHLKIKGGNISPSEPPKPAQCDDSELYDANITRQEKTELIRSLRSTVLGLGTALGLCALLIFFLIYFILRRKTSQKMNTIIEDSPGMMQESEAETLNYAALQFKRRKAKADHRKSSEASVNCVYSIVN